MISTAFNSNTQIKRNRTEYTDQQHNQTNHQTTIYI